MAEFTFGRVEWDVVPNTTGFGRRAEAEIKAQVEGRSVAIDVEPNTRGLAAALRRQLKEAVAAGNVRIEVPVKTVIRQADLRADLRVIQDQLRANPLEVTLRTTIREADIRADIARMQQIVKAAKNIEIPLSLRIDRGQMATELRVLREQVKSLPAIDVKFTPISTKASVTAELKKIQAYVKAAADIKVPLVPTVNLATVSQALNEMRRFVKALPAVEVKLEPTVGLPAIRRALRDLNLALRAQGATVRIKPEIDPTSFPRFVAEVRRFVLAAQAGIPHLQVVVSANTRAGSGVRAVAQDVERSLLGPRRQLSELETRLLHIARSAGAITGPLGGIGSQFARMANTGSLAAIAIGSLTLALGGVLGFGVKVAAEAELADTGIRALTKSVGLSHAQASGFIKQLEEFAAVTPFEVPEVKEATKFLLGAGFAVEEILPTLERITDVGAVLGVTTQNIENVARAIAKLQGRGFAQLRELNLIRTNLPGFDPVAAIAEFKGQSLATTYEQITKKAIPASVAIAAINEGLVNFPGAAGAAARASQTLIGLFSTLKDTVKLAFKDAFLQPEVLLPLKDILRGLIKDAEPQIKGLAVAVTPILSSLGPVLNSLVDTFTALLKSAAPFFAAVLDGATVLSDALLPVMENLGPVFLVLGDAVVAIAPVLASIAEIIAVALVPAASAFRGILTAIEPILAVVAGALSFLADQTWLVTAAVDAFIAYKLVTFLSPIVSTAIDAGKALFGMVGAIQSVAATQGVGFFTALKGVMQASGKEALGLAGGLGAASLATAGITAVIAGGLFLYQNWAEDTKRVKDETEALTKSLLDATSKAGALRELAEQFQTILTTRGDPDDGFAAAFNKTGIAIGDVTSIINKNTGDIEKFRKTWHELGETPSEILGADGRLAAGIPKSVQPMIRSLFELERAGILSERELGQVIDAMTDLDKEAKASSLVLQSQGKQFAAQAKGAKLSAESQKNLNLVLSDTTPIDVKTKALAALKAGNIDIATAAGLATGELSEMDIALGPLADQLGGDAELAGELAKAISDVSDSLTSTFDAIRGTDVLTGPNSLTAQLGGASQAIVALMQDGELTQEEMLGLAQQMGLTADATEDLIRKGAQFGQLFIDQVKATQDAFKGLIPTVGSVFEELKSKADGVLPTYDELLKGLERKLTESAQVTDNLATILRRGGTGIIKMLEGLPAEAQAAYAAAIVRSDDATFGRLEVKSKELSAEAIRQVQNQGVLAVGIQNETVAAGVAALGAAQQALIDIAAQTRAKLTTQANDPSLRPGQRKLLRDDRTGTTAATVADSLDASTLVGQTVTDINAALATIPGAAQKAQESAVVNIKTLGPQIAAATIPQITAWKDDMAVQFAGVETQFATLADRALQEVILLGDGLPAAFELSLSAFDTFAAGIVAYSDGIAFNVQNLADTMVATFDSLPSRLVNPMNRALEVIRQFADAINSVAGQVGSKQKIDVPRVGISGARVGKIEVRHAGGVIGDGLASTSPLDGPLLTNERLVKGLKGEGVVPRDAMKKIGLPQFRFIQKGDIEGLFKAQAAIPAAKAKVDSGELRIPKIETDLGRVVGAAVAAATHGLADSVRAFLRDADTLITQKINTAWGFTPGKGVSGGAGLTPLTAAMGAFVRSMIPGTRYTSTVRPGAVTAHTGNPSLHAVGKAIDFGGNLPAIFELLSENFARLRLRELIYAHTIISAGRGRHRWPYKDHFDHVHAGTYELGGISLAEQLAHISERNRPELILPLQNAQRTEDLLARYIFDPTVSAVNPEALLDRLEKIAEKRAPRKAAPELQINIPEGGSLVTINAQSSSADALAAEITPRVVPFVRQLLST